MINMSCSIVIPSYNSKKWISKCIDSILLQVTNVKYEIIVIDDGSIDGTNEFLFSNYSKHKNIRIYSQKNSGPSAARNYGLSLAKYDYILFIDSDDFVNSDYLNTIENIYCNHHFDLLIFGLTKNSDNCNYDCIVTKKTKYARKKDIKRLITKEIINSPCNKVYKKSILDKYNISFNTDVSIGEDYLFNMEYMYYCEKIILLNRCLYNYVINNNDNSLTKKYKKNKYKEFKIIDCQVKKIYKNMYKSEINFLHIKHLYSCFIDELLNNKNEVKAKLLLKEIKDNKVYSLKDFFLVVLIPNLGLKRLKKIIYIYKMSSLN